MLKILHIIPSYKPAYGYGGTITAIGELCEQLQKSGNTQVTVYTTTANGKTELSVVAGKPRYVEGVEVFYFKRITKDHTHFSPALLRTLWKNVRQYDVIHIHSWWNLVAMLALCVCRLRGIQPIVTPHGMLGAYTLHSKWKRKFHNTIGKHLLKKVHLHATSGAEQRELAAIQPAENIAVIPNFVSIPPQLPVKKMKEDAVFRLVFLSRIDRKKGLDVLFKSLVQLDFEYELTIMGTGDEAYINSLKALAGTLHIAPRLQWKGQVMGAEKYNLLARADLFVLTSHNENFANVVIESIYTGTPVLVSEKMWAWQIM